MAQRPQASPAVRAAVLKANQTPQERIAELEAIGESLSEEYDQLRVQIDEEDEGSDQAGESVESDDTESNPNADSGGGDKTPADIAASTTPAVSQVEKPDE